MLKYGDKEFRNLEEQVGKNQEDIQRLKTGIRIEKYVSYADFTALISDPDNQGKYFLVPIDGVQTLFLVTKNSLDVAVGVNLGRYPAVGPEGPKGPKGEKGDSGESIRGPQGIQGIQGIPGRPGAGWNTLSTIDTSEYTPTFTSQDDDVLVETSANLITNEGTPDEETKEIDIKFEIPNFNKNKVDITEVAWSTPFTYIDEKPRVYHYTFDGQVGYWFGQIYRYGNSYTWELENLTEATRYYGLNIPLTDPTFEAFIDPIFQANYALANQLSGKADKVSGATSGNFAGLDSNGNLTDSGKKASNFQGVSGQITIETTDWSSNIATKIFADFGAYDLITFYPATVSDKENASASDIFVSASSPAVIFTATTTPTADITFNYFITRGTN